MAVKAVKSYPKNEKVLLIFFLASSPGFSFWLSECHRENIILKRQFFVALFWWKIADSELFPHSILIIIMEFPPSLQIEKNGLSWSRKTPSEENHFPFLQCMDPMG